MLKEYRSMQTGEVVEAEVREYRDYGETVRYGEPTVKIATVGEPVSMTIKRWLTVRPNGLDLMHNTLRYRDMEAFRKEWRETGGEQDDGE